MDKIIQYKGTSFSLPLIVTTEDDGVSTVFNLTGYTAYLTLKKNKEDGDGDAVLQKTVTVHTNPTQGETEFTLDPADTASLEACSYVFDIEIRGPSDTPIWTLYVGTWDIVDKVKD